jgi:hypothetical protein
MLAIVIKMIHMNPIIFLVVLLSTVHLTRPKNVYEKAPTAWSKARDWRLYYTRSKKAFAFPPGTLKMLKSVQLNEDSMMSFMATVTTMPTGTAPLWMGYYIASCKLPDDSLIKIEISQYGRFFYDGRDKLYYQLTDEMQDNWQNYLTAKWRTLEGVSD